MVGCDGANSTVRTLAGLPVEDLALTDPDDLHRRWFAEHDATCALVRPDFHLYGTAGGAGGAAALLDDLRAHLAPGPALTQGAAT